ncbi:MAG: TonB-dependent receptor [Sphingomicrobium sp.]
MAFILAAGTPVAAQAAGAPKTALAASTQASATANPAAPDVGEIVVTAQKRAERINDVGMSITAVSGDTLVSRGAQDVTLLPKLVPGFSYNTSVFGNPIFSIRGIGFQDSTLGASPTVATYLDEVPVPFSAETSGVVFDIARLEVLKGPQGTLFGENTTGGALNFITGKPTRAFEAGFDGSFGRFSTADASGFLSGPLGDTLQARIGVRVVSSDDWQQSYTRKDALGEQNLLQGRATINWTPTSGFRVSLSANAWQDRSESPAPQLIGIVGLGRGGIIPALATYPNAPRNDRAADWDPNRDYRRKNSFVMGTLRADYDLNDAVTLTSISSLQRYKRNQPIEADGTAVEDLFLTSLGRITTAYQELRLSGTFGRGHFIAGLNYEHDKIRDNFFQEFADSSSRLIFGFLPLTESLIDTKQRVKTYAAYGNVDFPVTDTIQLHGGLRYTKSDRTFIGCGRDSNGQLAAVYDFLRFLVVGPVPPIPVGGCTTLNPATFAPELANLQLKEDNISWRGGIDWKVTPGTLVYANVSRGYKAGSYPTLAASSTAQFSPVTQESVLAYEAGFKATLLDRVLQLNAAAFYYKYTDKQVLGRIPVPIFGPLLKLVNGPKSHIEGVELEADLTPVQGLSVKANGTYIKSRIDGNFSNYDSFGTLRNFTGEAFPYTPKFQATIDGQYEWRMGEGRKAFVGANVSHHSKTNGSLGEFAILDVDPYTLLDLRAGYGAASGAWKLSVWGRNVTNKYYWVTAVRDNDTINRYTGMPATYGVTLSLRTR